MFSIWESRYSYGICFGTVYALQNSTPNISTPNILSIFFSVHTRRVEIGHILSRRSTLYIYTYIYIYMCVCMCAYICVYMYVWYVYMHVKIWSINHRDSHQPLRHPRAQLFCSAPSQRCLKVKPGHNDTGGRWKEWQPWSCLVEITIILSSCHHHHHHHHHPRRCYDYQFYTTSHHTAAADYDNDRFHLEEAWIVRGLPGLLR